MTRQNIKEAKGNAEFWMKHLLEIKDKADRDALEFHSEDIANEMKVNIYNTIITQAVAKLDEISKLLK